MDNPTELLVKSGISLAQSEPISNSRRRSPASPSTRTRASSSGITMRTTLRSAADSATKPKLTGPVPFICQICFDDSQTESLSLSCGHKFCTECWSFYLKSKIREEGESSIGCMATNCTLIAPDSFIESTLENDEDTVKRHRGLIVRHYVGHNPALKFCPYPSCTYTVSCPVASSKSALTTIVPTVHCGASQNHVFCFGCTVDSDHRPVICDVAKLWLKKCQDDSETANWIKSNTKECSKCQSTIEKNGGCKYVRIHLYYHCVNDSHLKSHDMQEV